MNNQKQNNWWQERCEDLGIAQSLDMVLLHAERSPYQLIEIFEHAAFGRVLVLDGYLQASQADEFIYHEMGLQVPLLGRKRENTSVLIIGGGDGGSLRESLVHDFVTAVTMVEIDRRVVELSKEFLGVNGDYNDPRVNLIFDDAGNFVRDAKLTKWLTAMRRLLRRATRNQGGYCAVGAPWWAQGQRVRSP